MLICHHVVPEHTTFRHIVFIIVFSGQCASIINFSHCFKKICLFISVKGEWEDGYVWHCLHPFLLPALVWGVVTSMIRNSRSEPVLFRSWTRDRCNSQSFNKSCSYKTFYRVRGEWEDDADDAWLTQIGFETRTHLELLNSSLQALCGEVGIFGWQLILRCLKPPEEGAGEAAELEQLMLTGLDGSKPVRKTHRPRMAWRRARHGRKQWIERMKGSCMKEDQWWGKRQTEEGKFREHVCCQKKVKEGWSCLSWLIFYKKNRIHIAKVHNGHI